MQIVCLCSGNIPVFSYTQNFMPRSIFNRAGHEILGVAEDRDISGTKTLYLHPEWAREIFAKEGLQEAIRQGSWAGETTSLGRYRKEIHVSQVVIAHKRPDGDRKSTRLNSSH